MTELARPRPTTRWIGPCAAIALPALAVLLWHALRPFLDQTLFVLFFPAIAVAAWYGGLSSGLLATVLSVVLADYYIVAPLHRILPLSMIDVVRLTIFGISALVISRAADALAHARGASVALSRDLEQRERHLKEQLEEGQALTEELAETNDRLQRTNDDLQRTQARGEHLFTLAARLSEAATPHDVAAVMFEECLAAVHADAGSLGMRVEEPDGSQFIDMIHSHGYGADATATYQHIPLTPGRPLSDAFVARQPVLLRSSAEWAERYPLTHPIVAPMGYEAFAAVPIVLGDRAVAGVCFSFRDIREFDDDSRAYLETMARLCAQALERARAYEAESRARKRTTTIVESIADGFVAFDARGRFTHVNSRAAEMWRRSPSELLGRTPREAFPEHLGSPVNTFLERAIREQRVATFEDFAPTFGRWIEMRAYPSEDGGLVTYFQDVTERRRTQDATAFLAEASRLLTASSDYAETLANLAHAAVPRLGDWCAVDVLENPASNAWPPVLRRVAVVHQDPEKIALGERMTTAYPTDWSNPHGVARVLREGKSMFVPEVTEAMLQAGSRNAEHLAMMRALQFNSVMAVPLVARERVLGYLTLCMTESGRRYSEADLALAEELARRAGTSIDNARLLRDAETANATKTEFLRTISHELRQPLNATMSFLQLWELGLRGELTPQQRDDLARVQRNQRHLMSLIEDLLSFTRLEAGRLEVERAPVVMDDALQSLEAMVAPQMAAKSVSFAYEGCDRTLVALGDRHRIVQICVNLLTNAMRATERGGRVRMECSGNNGVVTVVVADTGVGIPADKLESIFLPFTQLGRALNQPKEGAGLGLAIARGLAEAMGGSLSATSAVGIGSTFVLELPRG